MTVPPMLQNTHLFENLQGDLLAPGENLLPVPSGVGARGGTREEIDVVRPFNVSDEPPDGDTARACVEAGLPPQDIPVRSLENEDGFDDIHRAP